MEILHSLWMLNVLNKSKMNTDPCCEMSHLPLNIRKINLVVVDLSHVSKVYCVLLYHALLLYEDLKKATSVFMCIEDRYAADFFTTGLRKDTVSPVFLLFLDCARNVFFNRGWIHVRVMWGEYQGHCKSRKGSECDKYYRKEQYENREKWKENKESCKR